MTRKDLAIRSLWSDHPLCQLFALANGEWINGQFIPATSWSVRELIAFAELLPEQIISRIEGARQ